MALPHIVTKPTSFFEPSVPCSASAPPSSNIPRPRVQLDTNSLRVEVCIMSFGYSVGDLIAVIQLANKVRRRFVDSPAQFRAISDEVKCLSNLLRDADDTIPDRSLTQSTLLICKIIYMHARTYSMTWTLLLKNIKCWTRVARQLSVLYHGGYGKD